MPRNVSSSIKLMTYALGKNFCLKLLAVTGNVAENKQI